MCFGTNDPASILAHEDTGIGNCLVGSGFGGDIRFNCSEERSFQEQREPAVRMLALMEFARRT